MRSRFLPVFAALLVFAGCERRQESAAPADGQTTGRSAAAAAVQPPSEDTQQSPRPGQGSPDDATKVTRYDTGDRDDWPAYDFPLEIRLEVPEVPEHISRPSPEIPGDESQGEAPPASNDRRGTVAIPPAR